MENLILVGLDGSSTSALALDWAISEAWVRKWPLRLVSVYPYMLAMDLMVEASYIASAEKAAHAILNDAIELATAGDVHAEAHVVRGDAREVLVMHSKAAAFAVVGKRGRDGFSGRLLGSVSSSLAAHSKCPTVVIPQRGEDLDTEPSSKGRSAGLNYEGQIVLAMDALGVDHPGMGDAAGSARTHSKPLSLVTVLPPLPGDSNWSSSEVDSDRYQRAVSELRRVVVSVAGRFPALEVSGEVHVGKPADILTQISQTADLLVLGTRGHGGFPGLLLGSVSQAVLHLGRAPMMIVPTPGREK